ncbi:MAG TPA: cytochrome c peroxidase [Methylomirabilota bacterium]|jgi:cytochrome c peroxidase|nr:cytochrome c peroxidase [Methylomirabilota bacterium]
MAHVRWLGTAAVVLAVVTLAGAAEPGLRARAQALFAPLPPDMGTLENPVAPERVRLGRLLFFDPRIAVDGAVSCARCHQAALYGADALPRSIGAEHRTHPRHAQTVFNAAAQFVQHWRGDRTSVEDQAIKSLTGPPAFGNPTAAAAMARLKAIPGYPPLFARAFPGAGDPVTPENFATAVGAYVRTLVTPAPFDAFLRGDERALSAAARAGLATFIRVGCAACHNGVAVGGSMYQKFGITEDYWRATGSAVPDKGRFDMTQDPADLYVFKVAGLRNVAMTPPYFHDGSVATLPEAVRVMARVQLGRTLTDGEVTEILAFLESLTGPVPADFATAPILPPAGVPSPAAR